MVDNLKGVAQNATSDFTNGMEWNKLLRAWIKGHLIL